MTTQSITMAMEIASNPMTLSAVHGVARFVPGYCVAVPFTRGIRRTIEWFDSDTERRQVDTEADARWDKLIEAYEHDTRAALSYFVVQPCQLETLLSHKRLTSRAGFAVLPC